MQLNILTANHFQGFCQQKLFATKVLHLKKSVVQVHTDIEHSKPCQQRRDDKSFQQDNWTGEWHMNLQRGNLAAVSTVCWLLWVYWHCQKNDSWNHSDTTTPLNHPTTCLMAVVAPDWVYKQNSCLTRQMTSVIFTVKELIHIWHIRALSQESVLVVKVHWIMKVCM